ncbi:hypothetical protein BH11MYX1_BH11MYX1_21750 [soil metagenome]
MRSLLLWVSTVTLSSACGGGVSSSPCEASITANGANATHDHFSAGAANGDWSAGDGNGTLDAISLSADFEQALQIEIVGPVPIAGQSITLLADQSTGSLQYADASGQTAHRVWTSSEGTLVIDSVIPSTTDHSTSLELHFTNVTAHPSTVAAGNSATGVIVLDGSARIDGVYLPLL